MKYRLFILVLIGLITGKIQAQNFVALSYSTSMGVGDLGDYISEYSFRGGAIDYRGQLKGNIVAGVSASWNVFYEKKDYESYTFETVTATGKQYRYTNATPLMGCIDYTGKTEKGMQWFAGLGIGTTYIDRVTDFGSYSFTYETWQFLLSPEAGISYPMLDNTNLYLSARYNQNFKSKDLDAQSYFSINLGLAWGDFSKE